MAKSRKRKRNKNKRTSFLGALLIESLAVVVMIGLFCAARNERTSFPTVDELIRPVSVDIAQADQCSNCVSSIDRIFTSLESVSTPARDERDGLAVSEKRSFQWRDPFEIRR